MNNTDKLQLVCLDTETNGLSINDDILTISARILNPDGTPTEREFYSMIYSDASTNADAFAVNGIKREDLLVSPKKERVIEEFLLWWAKECHGKRVSPMGHNFLGFDKPRLERFFGDDWNRVFHYHSDDSMVIARALQRTGLLPVDSCSLKTLASFFGVKFEHAHNASADTYVCGVVYSKLLKILQPNWVTRLIRVFYPRYLGI